MNNTLITVHNLGRYYCDDCGHDEQLHAKHRVITSGAISTTPVCHRDKCKCGHSQNPRIKL